MKKNNLFKLSALLLLLFSIATGTQSCNKGKDDACSGCENGGYCDNGTCNCAYGYDGIHCSMEARAKFIGSYTVTGGNISCPISGNSIINTGTIITIINDSVFLPKMAISIQGTLTVVANADKYNLTFDSPYTGTGSINSLGTILTLHIGQYNGVVPETCFYSITAAKQ